MLPKQCFKGAQCRFAVLGQYYQLIRFGKAGYTAIMSVITETADFLAAAIANFPNNKFTILSEGEGKGLPLVAWKLTNKEDYDEFAIARVLRMRCVSVRKRSPVRSLTSLDSQGDHRPGLHDGAARRHAQALARRGPRRLLSLPVRLPPPLPPSPP